MNQEVTQYIEKIDQKWQADVCKHLRETVLQSIPGVEELLQYGKPHYKKDGKFISTYNTAKAWVSFTLLTQRSSKHRMAFLNLVITLKGERSRSVKSRRQIMIF